MKNTWLFFLTDLNFFQLLLQFNFLFREKKKKNNLNTKNKTKDWFNFHSN